MARDHVYTFKDPKGLARSTRIALGAHALAAGAMGGFMLLAPGATSAEAEFDVATTAFDFTSLFYFLTLPFYAILFLMWVYRANRNAQSFTGGMEVSPGWNVGWFFVPVASLWKPFQGLDETWRVSHAPTHWMVTPTPVLLRCWWSAYLASSVMGVLSNLLRTSETSNEVSAATVLTGVSLLANTTASALAIVMVNRISAAQIRTAATEVFV
jgi:hypothetical protein